MATFFSHTCENCGYSVHTSGPHEFYRDSDGNRKQYGHPVPLSEEAKQRGIYGSSGILYCAKCDEVVDVITFEYEKPIKSDGVGWSGPGIPKYEYKEEKPIKCPKCGGQDLIPSEDEEVACPRCRKGKLIGKVEFIT